MGWGIWDEVYGGVGFGVWCVGGCGLWGVGCGVWVVGIGCEVWGVGCGPWGVEYGHLGVWGVGV